MLLLLLLLWRLGSGRATTRGAIGGGGGDHWRRVAFDRQRLQVQVARIEQPIELVVLVALLVEK